MEIPSVMTALSVCHNGCPIILYLQIKVRTTTVCNAVFRQNLVASLQELFNHDQATKSPEILMFLSHKFFCRGDPKFRNKFYKSGHVTKFGDDCHQGAKIKERKKIVTTVAKQNGWLGERRLAAGRVETTVSIYLVSFSLKSLHVVRQLSNLHLKHSAFTQCRLQLKLQSRYLRRHHRLILPTQSTREMEMGHGSNRSPFWMVTWVMGHCQ